MPSLTQILQSLNQLLANFQQHRHTGVDSHKISYNNLTDTPSVSNAAAGNSSDIQFNSSGIFGASDNFQYTESSNSGTITLAATNGSSNTQNTLRTPDSTTGSFTTGSLIVKTGQASGSGSLAGNITVEAGGSNSNASAAVLNLQAGGSNGLAQGGSVTIVGGSSSGTSTKTGDILLRVGQNFVSATQGDVVILPFNSIATGDNGGFFVLPIVNGTPTGTPTHAGSSIFDYSANKLWVYNGSAWKSVILT